MSMLLGILAGLVWGALCGGVNVWIMKRALKKGKDQAVMTANALRMAVDLAALGLVFLVRKLLPFRSMVATSRLNCRHYTPSGLSMQSAIRLIIRNIAYLSVI